MTDQFNLDFGDKGFSISYKEEPEESIELTVSHFGELHYQREIPAMMDSDQLFDLTYKIYFCIYRDHEDDDIIFWHSIRNDDRLPIVILKNLVDFFLSRGEDMKSIPLLVNSWPEVSKAVLDGKWNLE